MPQLIFIFVLASLKTNETRYSYISVAPFCHYFCPLIDHKIHMDLRGSCVNLPYIVRGVLKAY